MKLSVIIPVYRVEATLERCLQSVLRQTFSDLEVILVDDGSPDDCPRICDEWGQRDSRIRVVHKPNGGLSDARNAGLKIAYGEYVTFVDSDDFIAPDTYFHAMQLAAAHDIVEFPVSRFHGTPQQTLVSFVNTVYTDMEEYWLHGHAYEHTYACNKVYHRSLFHHVCFPIGKVFEDAWTLPLLLKLVRSVAMTDKGLYYYCQNEQGITCQANGRQLSQLLEAHVTLMRNLLMRDDRYYMYTLNIQLSVCKQTHEAPILPFKHVNIFSSTLSAKQRTKAFLLRTLGLKSVCKLYQTLGS